MRRTLTALCLCLCLCLSACAPERVGEQEQAGVTPEPTPTAERTPFTLPYYPGASLHPITGENAVNRVLGSLIYQGLFELDNTFTPHGVLCASSAMSEDGLTWSFTLKSASFSDGSPLTAEDVAASLELARSSPLYAGRLAGVTGVRALEDGTVAVTLTRPNGALCALLDIPVVRERGDGSLPLGTGPYAYTEDSGPLRLTRRAAAPSTAPGEIALAPIEEADGLIYAFDAGNVSLVVSDLTGANALSYSSGYEVFHYPTTTMLYVGFYTGKDSPCKDPLVRQAVSRSFDRDTVALSLLAGHARATCLPVHPDSGLANPIRERAGDYSPARAEELLLQAGWSREEGLWRKGREDLALTFVVNTDSSFKLAIAEYLAGQLSGLGMAVELKKLAWDDYVAALEAGQFDLYLGEVTLTADFDLTALLGKGAPLNYGGYENAQTAALLEGLRAAREDGRGQAANLFLNQFQAETPLAPLCFKNNSVLTQWRSVSGMEPTRQTPFYNLKNLRFGV